MAPKGPIDIHPTARPWSTQYTEDYSSSRVGQKKTKAHKQGRIWYRTPAATTVVPAPTIERAPVAPVKRYYVNMSDDEDDMNVGKLADSEEHVLPDPVPAPIADKSGNVTWGPVNTEAEIVVPAPEEIQREEIRPEPHWICWPEPTSQRPKTSLGIPRESGHVNQQNQLPTYEPELENWLNGNRLKVGRQTPNMYAYERSHSVYEPTPRRMTSISVNDMPRDSYTLYDGMRQQRSLDPTSLYRQNFFPYHQPGGAGVREGFVVQGLAKEMQGREPESYNRTYSFNKYPLHNRKTRYRVTGPSEDYVHDHSVFMTTTPRCVGHYIINPDWVSERSGIRRSHTMIQPNRTAKIGGLRY